jgi:hypothetical protein
MLARSLPLLLFLGALAGCHRAAQVPAVMVRPAGPAPSSLAFRRSVRALAAFGYETTRTDARGGWIETPSQCAGSQGPGLFVQWYVSGDVVVRPIARQAEDGQYFVPDCMLEEIVRVARILESSGE